MTLSSFLLTILWLIIIPVVAGGIFSFRSKGFVAEDAVSWEKKSAVGIFLWSWLLGQLLLWCVFQVIAVWMILHEYLFTVVVKYYLISVVALCLISVVLNIVRVIRGRFIFIAGKAKEAETSIQAEDTKQVEALSRNTDSDKVFSETDQDSKEIKQERNIITVAWIVFFVVLAAQVVLQVVLAYMDADDAYYISEAVAIESSDYMYRLVPYTGLFTAMDYRHSLEPFPVWLAFVSRITGTQVVSMAHVFLPTVMLPLTYGAYSLMGHRVLGKKKKWLPIYMVIMEILVMFSLYSTKVPEKFFITRIRQGKSTISSLVIPGLFLCLFIVLEYAREKRRTDICVWIMLFMLSTAGCLCSTLGALLCALPVLIVAIMMVFVYKKGLHLIPMVIGCLPCFVYALLYLMNR